MPRVRLLEESSANLLRYLSYSIRGDSREAVMNYAIDFFLAYEEYINSFGWQPSKVGNEWVILLTTCPHFPVGGRPF